MAEHAVAERHTADEYAVEVFAGYDMAEKARLAVCLMAARADGNAGDTKKAEKYKRKARTAALRTGDENSI